MIAFMKRNGKKILENGMKLARAGRVEEGEKDENGMKLARAGLVFKKESDEGRADQGEEKEKEDWDLPEDEGVT